MIMAGFVATGSGRARTAAKKIDVNRNNMSFILDIYVALR